jgi:hypothetical protein
MHTFRAKAKAAMASKVKSLGGSQRKGYAFGGMVDGGSSAPRADKPSRKGNTTVNIVVQPNASPQPPPGGPGMPAPGAGMPPVPPPRPPPMPPQAGPGGPPMPMPPGAGPGPMGPMRNGGRIGFKKGGAVTRAEGGKVEKGIDILGRAAPFVKGATKVGNAVLDDAQASHAARSKAAGAAAEGAHKIKDAIGRAKGGRVAKILGKC